MSDKYVDTKNLHKIMDEIRTAPTLGHVKDIVEREYPGFIKGFLYTFSDDYPFLTQNWKTICDMKKTIPKQIMLTDIWEPDDNHVLIRYIAECFTNAGFLVRCITETVQCKLCTKALPSQQYYNEMKNKGVTTLPNSWSTACSNCTK